LETPPVALVPAEALVQIHKPNRTRYSAAKIAPAVLALVQHLVVVSSAAELPPQAVLDLVASVRQELQEPQEPLEALEALEQLVVDCSATSLLAALALQPPLPPPAVLLVASEQEAVSEALLALAVAQELHFNRQCLPVKEPVALHSAPSRRRIAVPM
jgi:hypothetical protein